jgi:hypothetical protein
MRVFSTLLLAGSKEEMAGRASGFGSYLLLPADLFACLDDVWKLPDGRSKHHCTRQTYGKGSFKKTPDATPVMQAYS